MENQAHATCSRSHEHTWECIDQQSWLSQGLPLATLAALRKQERERHEQKKEELKARNLLTKELYLEQLRAQHPNGDPVKVCFARARFEAELLSKWASPQRVTAVARLLRRQRVLGKQVPW